MAVNSPVRREIVINMNGNHPNNNNNSSSSSNKSKIWRESSYNFFQNLEKGNVKSGGAGVSGGGGGGEGFGFMQRGPSMEDPPSKLIGQFLHKEKATGEISLDIDLDMDELQKQVDNDNVVNSNNNNNNNNNNHNNNNSSRTMNVHTLPPVSESPTTNSVPCFESFKRRHSNSTNNSFNEFPQKDSEGEIVKCSSNRSFDSNMSSNRRSTLLTTKTKSRLLDPRVLGRSGQLESGYIGKNVEDEEEDPLLEEDLPEEYKNEKISIWVLLEWISLIMIMVAMICSLTIHYLKEQRLWKLELWKWEFLVLVLICGRLVSSCMVRIIVFCIERNFMLRKRVLYFVYGVKRAVQNCLWLGLVLLAWHYLFDDTVERETKSKVIHYVSKVLISLVVGVMLWMVKTLLVKVLASSFHMRTYFDRIQEALFNQYVIETLSGPPLIEIQRAEEEEEKIASEVQMLQNEDPTTPPGHKASVLSSPQSGRLMIGSGRHQKSPRGEKSTQGGGKSPRFSHALSNKEGDGITIDHLHKLNPKNVSAWNMKTLITIIQQGSLSTLDEQIHDSVHEVGSAPHIRNEYDAKAAARKIFHNVAKPGSKFIYPEDFMRFMNEDKALKTMSLFEEASESNKISKSALKNWVVNVFKERRALAFTLNDTKTAVDKLHLFVNILVGTIIVIIWLHILGIATTKFLLFVSSQLIVVAFVFGNTCKTVFEAIIFLFVIHPFDVGDRCEVDGVQMLVEEMNILTTVFLRYDNTKVVFPNSVLATKAISNYYRSPDMGDAVEFCVHIATPEEKIAQIKQRILSYIENRKDHWCSNPMIIFKDVEELNRVRIAVWLSHKMNHQDIGERWERRALLVEETVKILRELDIQYRMLPIGINIRAMPGPRMASDHLSPNRTTYSG